MPSASIASNGKAAAVNALLGQVASECAADS